MKTYTCRLYLAISLWGSLSLVSIASAQISGGARPPVAPPRGGAAGNGPAMRPGPPPLAAFDSAMALDHLARIDEPRVFATLQLNLFMRPTGALSADQALELVAAQAAKETPGSRRWVLLQSLRGFGGFQTRGQNAVGNEGYQTLFSTPVAPDATTALASALTTYLGSVAGASAGVRRADSFSSPPVLLAAMDAYLVIPEDKLLAEPNFAGALKTTGGHQEIAKALDARLKEKPVSETARLRLIKLAALVYESLDAERALELLDEAAPLADKIAPSDQAFNDLRVRLLVANERLKDAVTVQRAFVARNGKGRAELLLLQVRAGDSDGFRANVEALKQPDTAVADIFAAISALRRLPDKGAIRPVLAARELAESYLNTARERPLQSELTMKFTLARLLYAARERDAAVKLLQGVPEPPAEAGVGEKNIYRSMQQAVQEMQEGKYYDSWY